MSFKDLSILVVLVIRNYCYLVVWGCLLRGLGAKVKLIKDDNLIEKATGIDIGSEIND